MLQGLKIAGIIFVSIVFILIILVKGVLEPMIKSRVDNYIGTSDTEVYTYHYKKLSINLLGGSLHIKEVDAIPSPSSFDSLKIGKYEDIDRLFASEIYISVNYFTYVTERQIKISQVRIINPDITIYYFPEETKGQRDPVALDGIFSDEFQGFHMQSLTIENAKFTFQNILKETADFVLDSVYIRLNNIEINPETLASKPLGIGFNKVELESGSMDFAVNEYYDVHLDKINVVIAKNVNDSIKPLTNLLINGVSYQPNDFAMGELSANRLRVLSDIKTKQIEIKNFQLGELILEKKLNLKQLIIQNPEIRQIANSKMKKESGRNPSRFILKEYLEIITVEKFRIRDGTMHLTDIHKSNSDLVLHEVNIAFDKVVLNDSTFQQPLGLSFTRGEFNSSGADSDLGEFYTLATGPLHFDLVEGNASFSDIKLIPKHTREAFSKVTPYEQDQFDISIGNLLLKNLDLRALNEDLSIKLNSAIINNLALYVYRDKWVEDQEFVYKPLPSHSIRNIKIPIWIDSIQIKNSIITYTQLGDVVEYEGEQPGTITFNNVFATGYRLTNNPVELKRNPEFVLNAQAKFMNTSKLTAQYRFVIPDTTDLFYVKAKMDSFPTNALDPMLKNLLLVSVPKGMIHHLEIDMMGNDDKITGKISMEYEKLNIDILKSKKPTKSSGFLNTIANGVIKRNNLRKKGRFTVGLVNTERRKNKSVFNYTWNGIKSGMISTVMPFVKKEKTKKKSKRSK